MKENIFKYIIANNSENLFWCKTFHYGWNYQNEEVLTANFCSNIEDATFLNTKEKAYKALDQLRKSNIIISGNIKTNIEDLYVATVGIQYEII